MAPDQFRPDRALETVALPPPSDSTMLEDNGVLRSCLLLARKISDFREAYARCRSPETAGKLMLILEARNELARKDLSINLRDFFTSSIVGDPSDSNHVRMESYINACLSYKKEAKDHSLSVKTINEIASHFLMDKISWRLASEVLLEKPLLPDNEVLSGEKLKHQLHLWEVYARKVHDLDPYIHLILTYLYFIAISPLNRDNQLVGGILLQIGMQHKGFDSPYPCIQLGKAKKDNPHSGLEEKLYGLRTRKWSPYLLYSLRTIWHAFEYTSAVLTAMERLYDETVNYLLRLGLTAHVYFVHALFVFPCCRTGEFSSITGTRRQTSSHILNDLVKAGILEQRADGRDKIYINKRLIELLESPDYAFSYYPTETESFIPLYRKGIPEKIKKELETDQIYATHH